LSFGLLKEYLIIDGIKVADAKANAEKSQFKLGRVESPADISFLGGKKVVGIEPNLLAAPLKVLIEFTHNCNLRCIHCFADAQYCPGNEHGYLDGELNTEEWKIVINKLAAAGVFDIFVSGGEPLIRKDIFEIMAHVKPQGMGFCLLTNATLIDDEVAQKLGKLGCYKVEANLDGPDAESYDAFRGVKGAFEATVKGVEACLRNGLGLRCNVTATKKNVYQLKEIVDTAWRIGVRELCTVPLEPGGRANSNAAELELSMEDHAELQELYKDVANWVSEKYGNEFIFIGATDLLLGDPDSLAVSLMNPNQIMPLCGAGRVHCSIGPTGHVILCPTAGKQIPITPSDVLRGDFKRIWHEADIFQQVRRADIPGCSTCEFAGCNGGCHVRTFHKYGKVAVGPDHECRKVLLKKIAERKEPKRHAAT